MPRIGILNSQVQCGMQKFMTKAGFGEFWVGRRVSHLRTVDFPPKYAADAKVELLSNNVMPGQKPIAFSTIQGPAHFPVDFRGGAVFHPVQVLPNKFYSVALARKFYRPVATPRNQQGYKNGVS